MIKVWRIAGLMHWVPEENAQGNFHATLSLFRSNKKSQVFEQVKEAKADGKL
jgi:hypothetical protein